MSDPLSPFFAPSSIAIIGASDDPTKWGHTIAKQALRSTHCDIYFVNARSESVLGKQCDKSLTEIDGEVDLAVVSVPVKAFESVIDDAIAKRVKGVLAITAGFAELGGEGEQLQNRCRDKLRSAGIRLIGPNCLGLADNNRGIYLAANDFIRGNVALISQSGNLALEFDVLFRENGIGFSRFISLGNQADVTLVDAIESCVNDSATQVIALYIEDFIDGREFLSACIRSTKPIILLATAGSGAAQRSAGSHTGAITSTAAIIETACNAAGIIKVDTPHELVVAALVNQLFTDSKVSRVGVVTDGGGHGTIACGLIESSQLEVPELSSQLQEKLSKRLWEPSSVVNPVDLAGYGEQDLSSYCDCASLLINSNEVDAVLITGYFGGYSSDNPFAGGLGEAEIEAAQSLVKLANSSKKIISAHSMARNSKALDILRAASIPVFNAVEDAVKAIGYANKRIKTPLQEIHSQTPIRAFDYVSMRNFLSEFGLPSGLVVKVESERDAEAALEKLGSPVVLKTLESSHKSDFGGVFLNLNTKSDVKLALRDLFAKSKSHSASIEQMIETENSVELLIGIKNDVRFGPVLIVGAGGTKTELIKDSTSRLAPIDSGQAEDMLRELRIWPIFEGFRGGPKFDIKKIASVISEFSKFGAAHPEMIECEINPLIVAPNSVNIADVRAFHQKRA